MTMMSTSSQLCKFLTVAVIVFAAGILPAQEKPLTKEDIFTLLQGQVAAERISVIIQTRGIDFEPDQYFYPEAARRGATPAVLDAIRVAVRKRTQLAEANLRQAEDNIRSGDNHRAEQSLRDILDTDPAHPQATRLLGMAYLGMRQWTNADHYLSQAIAMGETVKLPVSHRHSPFFGQTSICEGELELSRGKVAYQPYAAREHAFEVEKVDLVGLKRWENEYRTVFVGLVVNLPDEKKPGKRKKRDFDFTGPRAQLLDGRGGSPVKEIYLPDSDDYIRTVIRVIGAAIR
jgi:hypothetical protein